MTTDACRGWRERLGPYLTGRASATERAAVEAHLEGCAACRRERDLLAPVARALDVADPSHVLAETEQPPADLEPRVVGRIRGARRERRRRVGLASAAAGIAIVLALSLALFATAGPGAEQVMLTGASPRAAGAAELVERAWGTEVHLRAWGLSSGTTYVVWLEAVDGERVQGGTFRAPGPEEVRATLAIALDRDDSVVLGVTATGGDTVLQARLGEDR